MKLNYEVSPIIRAIFDLHVSPAEKKNLSNDGRTYDKTGKYVRIQCYVPLEAYAILKMFGAFKNSESAFFSEEATSYIEQRAIELEIMPSVLDYMKGAR